MTFEALNWTGFSWRRTTLRTKWKGMKKTSSLDCNQNGKFATAFLLLSWSAVSKNSMNFTPIHNFWTQISIVICLMWLENFHHAIEYVRFRLPLGVLYSFLLFFGIVLLYSQLEWKKICINSQHRRFFLWTTSTFLEIYLIYIYFSKINEKFQMNGEKFWLNFEYSIEYSNVFFLQTFLFFLSLSLSLFVSTSAIHVAEKR